MLVTVYYTEDGEPVDDAEFKLAFDEVASARNAHFETTGAGYFELFHLLEEEVDELITGDFVDTVGDHFTINYVPEEA